MAIKIKDYYCWESALNNSSSVFSSILDESLNSLNIKVSSETMHIFTTG